MGQSEFLRRASGRLKKFGTTHMRRTGGREGIAFHFSLALFLLFMAAVSPGSGAEEALLLPARQERKIEKGVFLIADLRLIDPNFSKTVVLITRHGPGGSLGVVINRPTQISLSRAFPTMKNFENRSEALFIGGPVQREVMIPLLRTETPPESAFPIFEKVYLVPQIQTLAELLTRGDAGDRFRIYSGYAGWAPGQLQNEIDRGDWRILPGEADLLFRDETGPIWEELLRRSSQRSVQRERRPGRPS